MDVYEHLHRLNRTHHADFESLRTHRRLRKPATVTPTIPMEMSASDDGSGATFDPGSY